VDTTALMLCAVEERGATPGCGIYRSGGRLGDEDGVVNAGAVMGCNSNWR